jgi:hypothetical protein
MFTFARPTNFYCLAEDKAMLLVQTYCCPPIQRREQLFVLELLINMAAPKPAPLEPIITHSRGTALDRAFSVLASGVPTAPPSAFRALYQILSNTHFLIIVFHLRVFAYS